MELNGPRQAAFQTAEILEQILIHLPFKTLWTCQRVCKQFQAMTETSPALQEIMMLRPRGGPRECWRIEGGKGTGVYPPYFVVYDPGKEAMPMDGKGTLTPARLCSLLQVWNGSHGAWKIAAVRHIGNRASECVVLDCSPRVLSSWSWKNLLVTDPPCFEADVDLSFVVGHYGIPDGTLKINQTVRNPKGLRMGDLVDEVLRKPEPVRWSLNGKRYFRFNPSPEKVLSRLEKQLGVKAILDVDKTVARSGGSLRGMVIPTEEEWEQVGSAAA